MTKKGHIQGLMTRSGAQAGRSDEPVDAAPPDVLRHEVVPVPGRPRTVLHAPDARQEQLERLGDEAARPASELVRLPGRAQLAGAPARHESRAAG